MLRPHSLACAVALALASSAVFAQTAPVADSASARVGLFDHMVIFGDSLSDAGNLSLAAQLPMTMRFTTNPGETSIEDVAAHFGVPATPSLAGGTDFAFGGAGLIHNSPGTPAGVPLLPDQLGQYLTATGGRADADTLYSVWGGANDIFYAATSAAAAGVAQQLIAQNVAAQIMQLQTAGLPQAQIDALTPQITQAVTAAVVQQVQTTAGVTSLMNAAQVQASVQQAAATELGMLGGLAKAGAHTVMVFNLPNIGLTPSGLAQGPAAAAQLTGLSLLFNNTLNTGLAAAGVDIVPVNTFALLDEIVADPSTYGFSNVTQPACTGGDGSSFGCLPAGTPGAAVTYQPGTENSYLFADGVHPTTAAQAMLGEYAVSILTAPGEISLLGMAPLAINRSVNQTITNQARAGYGGAPSDRLRLWANYDHARQRLDAQVGSPGSHNDVDTLSVGADIHASDVITTGLAFTVGQSRDHFAGNLGGFKLQDLLATGYAMFGFDNAYVGAIGSFGHLGYQNIHRDIAIGPSVRHEAASTSGSHLAFTLTGGWWVDFGTWRTGPYADLGWQHVHVSGFAENGSDATAMTFSRQDRHALIGTLGWQLAGDLKAGQAVLHPYLKAAWNHDSKADPGMVRAGLVTMPGSFELPGYTPDSTFGSVGVGLAADITPQITTWIGYDGRFSDTSQHLSSFNMGARLAF